MLPRHAPPRQPRRRARGAALLIAMIMIFMLSIAGISTMRNANLEQQMAANSILTSDVLQAAESANELILNDPGNLASTYLAASNSMEIDSPLGDESPFDSRVELRYVGEGNALGTSLNGAQGTGNSFDQLRFVATGTARIDAVRASRRVEQGVSRKAPSN